jgi:hypothetical protein
VEPDGTAFPDMLSHRFIFIAGVDLVAAPHTRRYSYNADGGALIGLHNFQQRMPGKADHDTGITGV